MEARSGDNVRIHFTNNLEQPTNIHYHGLHIPITGNADNVFLKIEPEEKLTYEFQIPDNHPSGTFWDHPHLHGLVAEQLFGGLAGLFIVRGDVDTKTTSRCFSQRRQRIGTVSLTQFTL